VSDIRADPSQNEIEMLEAKEMWSEYQLADGTKLPIKPIKSLFFVRIVTAPQPANLCIISDLRRLPM
jgi:hypothetical protein